jgi:hypothetical protein
MGKGAPKNMKPLNTRTKEEQKRIASMGGKASGEARRKKASVQSIIKAWAEHPIVPAKLKAQAEAFGIDTDEGRALLALGMLQNAMKGNSKYLEKVLQMLGEDNPTAETPADGFIEAIKGTAAEDWGNADV